MIFLKTNTQIILGNTYHLLLRPGIEILEKFNGLHNFMNWNKPILTDSGGYQIMSLSKFNKIDIKMGAIFSSHLDGKKIILSPEKSIQVQKSINSDIIMVLDECPKLTTDKKILSKAIDVSTHWAKRCKTEFGNDKSKALFGIAQGGLFKDLRTESIEKLIEINFNGYAMGGLAVGEKQSDMFQILNETTDYLPKDKPRYLMGVGTPSDILGAVKEGIDMFDCVMPTRSGRTGLAFTWQGKVNLKNSKYQNDKMPLDKDCEIKELNKYSKSYLNHLIKSNEMMASMLISLHNIYFYQQFMGEIQKNIKNGTFQSFYKKYINLFD
jgi:queuine tRNA-ribosyltransferase